MLRIQVGYIYIIGFNGFGKLEVQWLKYCSKVDLSRHSLLFELEGTGSHMGHFAQQSTPQTTALLLAVRCPTAAGPARADRATGAVRGLSRPGTRKSSIVQSVPSWLMVNGDGAARMRE